VELEEWGLDVPKIDETTEIDEQEADPTVLEVKADSLEQLDDLADELKGRGFNVKAK